MQKIDPSEIWGGNLKLGAEVGSRYLKASLHSGQSNGAGGDTVYFTVDREERLTRVALVGFSGLAQAVSEISRWLFQSLSGVVDNEEANFILQKLNHLTRSCRLGTAHNGALLTFNHEGSFLNYDWLGGAHLLYRKNNEPWELLDSGMGKNGFQGRKIPVKKLNRFPLESGDRLFLFGEDLILKKNAQGEFFGINRLKDSLESSSQREIHLVKRKVLRALGKFCGETPSLSTFMVIDIL